MKHKKPEVKSLDAELRAYKGRYQLSNEYFLDVLGHDGHPLGKNPFLAKRRGKQEFTWREVKLIADLLEMTLEEIDEYLPDINH